MVKEFFGVNDLYFELSKLDVKNYPNLQNTIIKYNAAQGGCGCTRNTRVADANNTYDNLAKIITPEEVAFLKTSLSAETIVLKSGDKELGRY